MFCQTNLESIVPPIMNTYFGFDDIANSYFFLAAGGQLVGKQYFRLYNKLN